MLEFNKEGPITICTTAWPRDEHRWGYWKESVASIERYLQPAGQVSRWLVSCESEDVGDQDTVWRFCAQHGMDLVWRHGRPSQGANLNNVLVQVNTPWEFMIEDDIGLEGPLDLGKQLRFMDAHDGDYLSFLWTLQDGEGPMEGIDFDGSAYSVLAHDKMLWTFSNWPHLFRRTRRADAGHFDEWWHGLYANPECHYVHRVKKAGLRCFGFGQRGPGPGTAGIARHLGDSRHSSIKAVYEEPPVVDTDLINFQRLGFEVTHDWTAISRRNWMFAELRHLWGLPLRFLEIGVMEAYLASWMLTRVMTHHESLYVGIGYWDDNDTAKEERARAIRNLAKFPKERTKLIEGKSQDLMFSKQWRQGSFDVVFVDGGHLSWQALMDLFFAWYVLRRGGYLIIDDMDLPSIQSAVDQFLAHLPEWEWREITRNRQRIIRKFPVFNNDPPCAIMAEQIEKEKTKEGKK